MFHEILDGLLRRY